jgi:hypothetical protein
MKESYREDLASSSGLEPYALDGNIAGVASARGSAGQPLSSEIITFACRSCPVREKAISSMPLPGEASADAAESENLCMRRHPKRENREIPRVSNVPRHTGTAGKRLRRYSRHARSWEVRWSHSTCEADEQTRNPGSGVRGGKGITQGKCRLPRSCTGHSAGSCKASLHAATAGREVVS